MARSVTRRFNYTRRLEIPQSGVEIDLRIDNGVPVVVLLRLALPPHGSHAIDDWGSSRVVLEAWRTDIGAYQRFDNLGTVASIAGKVPVYSAPLTEFPDDQNITFRIKVVSATSKRLLAEADRLVASKDERHRQELIPVLLKDLGQLPWTIDWSDPDEGPKIFVNSNIERNRDLLTRDAVVIGLIVSAVLREVLYRVITSPDTQETAWSQRWKDFGARVSGGEAPSMDSDDIDTWVETVLLRFAETHSLSTSIEEHFKKNEGVA